MSAVSISVIILNHNSARFIIPCLTHAFAQDISGYEIILYDNASSDGSVKMVRGRFAAQIKAGKIRIIESDENLGFAEGNNRAVRAARGAYVVLLNSDTEVREDWLRELLLPLREHPEIALVGTIEDVQHPTVRDRYRVKRRMSTINPWGETVLVPRRGYGDAEHLLPKFISGNGIAFRKKEFPRPFDPSYFAYSEDNYLCMRAFLRGKVAVFNLRARMRHHGGQTRKQGGRINEIIVFNGVKNQLMNFFLFYRWWTIIRLLPMFLVLQLLHALFDLCTRPRALLIRLKAYWWMLINIPKLARKRAALQEERRGPDTLALQRMSAKIVEETLFRSPIVRGCAHLLNAVSRAYCSLLGIRTG